MENKKGKNIDSLNRTSFCLIIVIILVLSVCSSPVRDETFSLTIFHTNDHHGRTLAYDSNGNRIGGLAERVALIRNLQREAEAECDLCLLLDAGDVSSGTLFSDTFAAEPDWQVFGKFYDALAPGNHDFDFPLDGLLRIIDEFKVPVLSANIFDSRTDALLFPPYKIFRKNGWSIAVIGISHPNTPFISTLGNDPRLEFRSALEAAAEFVGKLKNEHDLIIVLSHWGQNDPQLAEKVEGIDLIIGGHSHSPFRKAIERNNTPIVNAGYGGRYIGRISLFLERKDQNTRVELTGYELIPVASDIPPDEEVESILQPYIDAFGNQGMTVVGEAGESFVRTPLSGPFSSSNLANLVADAYRYTTGADFAFVNRGGLRADLHKGPVTVDDLHAVSPFDNTLIVFEINGSEVINIIENMTAGKIGENGLLLPSNLLITRVDSGKPDVRSGDGQPLVPDEIYTVAVGSFIARGGDGHTIFPSFPNKYDTMLRTSAALRRYIEAKKTVFPDNQSRLK